MMLWSMLFLLSVIAACLVMRPLFRTADDDEMVRDTVNSLAYRDRLAELESEKEMGQLDEQMFEQLKAELQKTLLADVESLQAHQAGVPSARLQKTKPWGLAGLVLLGVPLLSIGVYLLERDNKNINRWQEVGEGLRPVLKAIIDGREVDADLDDYSMADFIHVLQRQAQSEGDNAKLWFELGMVYLKAQYPQFAEPALRKAVDLEPLSSQYQLALSQALMALNRGVLTPETEKRLRRVLADEPDNVQAQMMLAMGAYQSGNFPLAIDLWEKMLAKGDGQGEGAEILRRSIERARKKQAEQAAGADAQPPRIKVSVSLDPELQSRLEGDEFLMVYAQADSGMPMPLAIIKMQPEKWPVTVELTDAQAMAPNMNLSSVDSVVVTARISKSGKAKPEPGDYVAKSGVISVRSGEKVVSLEIASE